jgi:ABC-type dipeptide/oligopeptide/nickel transport system permease subunit
MLTNAPRYVVSAPWLVAAPGLLIRTTVLTLYVIADALHDALDPGQREA